MRTTNLKFFTLAIGLTAALLNPSFALSKKGGDSGGGGDASEERVDEIRSDILKWINDKGALGLDLSNELSYEEYVSKMSEILQPKKVVIGFVEEDDANNDELKVSVNNVPKTCRGFISALDSKPHILCNIKRFKNNSETNQYKLIHHEFAGLVNVENNERAASDYAISSQITDFLSEQKILRLAVKKNPATKNCIISNKMTTCLGDTAYIFGPAAKGFAYVKGDVVALNRKGDSVIVDLPGLGETNTPLVELEKLYVNRGCVTLENDDELCIGDKVVTESGKTGKIVGINPNSQKIMIRYSFSFVNDLFSADELFKRNH